MSNEDQQWVAGFRSAVISPFEEIQLTEPRGFSDQTVRQRLLLAGGGEQVRIRLTNRYGRGPLTIGATRVALHEADDVAVRFGGAAEVTIQPGREVVSDPVDLAVEAGAQLSLSLYLPGETGLATYSHQPMETAYVVRGDQVGAERLREAEEVVAGFTELARRIHAEGMTILAATIGPFAGAIYPGISTPEGLATRRRVNEWIRTSGAFDAVFDVSQAVQNPEDPDHIRPDFDSGDGMHLNDAGARAMAETVDLADLVL